VPNRDRRRQRGVHLGVSAYARAAADPTCGLKTTSYAFHLLARAETERAGRDEDLLLAPEGWVQEGLTSNVFCWRDGQLYTPTLTRHFLAGVTRQRLLAAARAAGIPCREVTLTLADLEAAEALFLTSGVMEVMPVSRFRNHRIDGVARGLEFQALLRGTAATS
jgi:branched-subunit amino acid aminotransferase/4-amino-4-deoxychorismate lyase